MAKGVQARLGVNNFLAPGGEMSKKNKEAL